MYAESAPPHSPGQHSRKPNLQGSRSASWPRSLQDRTIPSTPRYVELDPIGFTSPKSGMHSTTLNRRNFILTTSTALGALTSFGQSTPARRFNVIGFIKPFQKLSHAEIADISAEIGWSGIECPVR